MDLAERECKQEASDEMDAVTKVRPGQLVPGRFRRPLPLHLAPSCPDRQGCLRALVKATVICLLETLFGTCGEGPVDRAQSVSFLALAILKVSFGKLGKSEIYLIWRLRPLPVCKLLSGTNAIRPHSEGAEAASPLT